MVLQIIGPHVVQASVVCVVRTLLVYAVEVELTKSVNSHACVLGHVYALSCVRVHVCLHIVCM